MKIEKEIPFLSWEQDNPNRESNREFNVDTGADEEEIEEEEDSNKDDEEIDEGNDNDDDYPIPDEDFWDTEEENEGLR